MSAVTPQNAVFEDSRPQQFGAGTQVKIPFFGMAIILAIGFIIASGVFAIQFAGDTQMTVFIILAAVAGAYMALNIGANDVANNVSPAFGSGALTMFSAIILAAIFEAAGALIAGGSVVSTISKSIVDASLIPNSEIFVMIMISAMLSGALWLNLATYFGAPVSTTHSIVGAVLGAGIAAVGMDVVQWGVMSKIAASWVISPIIGGVFAALFLAFIDKMIFSRADMVAASRRWVPLLLGVMGAAFTVYLVLKGLKKVVTLDTSSTLLLGITSLLLISALTRPLINKASLKLENHRRGVNKLFTIPLIFSTALLSFAHGANDVANAIGPLSAVASVVSTGEIASKAIIPLWVMLLGAVGIAIGLALFGAKLIRKVGKHLTTLDQSRAYCICLSAAVTVITASALGMPVSSTHIAIGAVFGVGFYREFACNKKLKKNIGFLGKGKKAGAYGRRPRKLVRRKELLSIASAWIITVPCAALLSAFIVSVFMYVAGV